MLHHRELFFMHACRKDTEDWRLQHKLHGRQNRELEYPHLLRAENSRRNRSRTASVYILAYANSNFRDYTLLPIFPLRVFRHKSIFIRTDRGISRPEDLRGKKIATPGYSSTSLTWIRGVLEDEYGVKPNDIEWYVLLQQQNHVRLSDGTQGNKATFTEAYASIVGQIGSAAAGSKIDLEAAKVMQVQSSDWFESTAGVSLDEEAANLIQFQQSYAAAARILTTAQQMFETILQAAR